MLYIDNIKECYFMSDITQFYELKTQGWKKVNYDKIQTIILC